MEVSAHHITTQKRWTDVALNSSTLEQISALKDQVKYQQAAITDKANNTGFRVLFYGPSKADKSATAALLGNELGLDVYSINLSDVISQYIGETEKNIDQVFTRAKDKGWILFFDEADALFGKRTEATSEPDRYANQEVTYLIRRIEEYDGLVILSSNFRENIDDAFIRRFHAVIEFPLSSATKKIKQKQ